MMAHSKQIDVAIIGAGVAGLIAGCFLAKEGLHCSIYEAHYVPGGCAQGFRRGKGKYYFEAGAHLIGSIKNRAVLNVLLKRIGVEYPFISAIPFDRIHLPEMTINVPSNINSYRNFLSSLFPEEKINLEAFFAEMERVVRHSSRKEIADYYGPLPYKTLLLKYFSDTRLIRILSAEWGFVGENAADVSSIAMCGMLISYIRDGAGYAKGGMQRFCNILARRFKDLGGRIFLATRIKEAVPYGSELKTIITDQGERISAKFFICTTSPKEFYLKTKIKESVNKDLEQDLLNTKTSISLYLLFLGLNYPPERLYGINGWHFDSHDVDGSDSWVYIISPTLYDKKLAPQGKSVLEIAIIYPSFANELSVKEKRILLRTQLFKKLNKLVPNIENYIEILEDAIPETFVKYTSNPGGAVYGWAPRADNYFSRKRIANSNVLNNLFLAGHWSEPGLGVPSVAISGYLAASKILKHIKNHNL